MTGLPGQVINSAEPRGFANNPGGTPGEVGLWLRAFAGNTEQGLTNEAINAILSQTVPGTPGETYSFSGEASYEGNYSGGVPILDIGSPSGEIPSPTKNTFELAFLDTNGAVIDTFTRDVSSEVFNGFGYTAVTPVTAVAPAGTVEVRVSALAEDMLFNIDPGQSAFYDNFSLTASSAPGTELLINGNLNEFDPDNLLGFTFIEAPDGTNTLDTAGFANNTLDGSTGVWVRSFAEGDGTIQADIVPAAEGDTFDFSAFALFESNYSGGDPLQPTQTLLELAFLDGDDPETATVLTAETFDVASIVANGAGFTEVAMQASAPAGTQGVRASVVITDMVSTEGAQSAFFDDLSLTLVTPPLAGDYNNDGLVDAADYTVYRDALAGGGSLENETASPGVVDQADYNAWAANYGASNLPLAIPEPSCLALVVTTVAGVLRRRQTP